MNDRELLELAAKAAGIDGEYAEKMRMVREFCFETHIYIKMNVGEWNPLTNDGDALRLAVKTGLGVIQWRSYVSATHGPTGREWPETLGSDPCAATRRAIVRAAAEIGRQMQEGGAA